MLSPIPAIMEHCAANWTASLSDASERLIEKLILDPALVGSERSVKLALLIDKFKDEYGDFTNKRGKFNKSNIWIMAGVKNVQGFQWHKKYSLDCTDVLGRLACIVQSKILGIGSAERNWKQVKKIKRGDRARTGIDKTAKQELIYAQSQMLRAKLRKTSLSCAGKLWEDSDFDCMKMDEYCRDLQVDASAALQNDAVECVRIRNVKLWQERWEVPKRYMGKGRTQLEARLEKKYVGLKLREMEGDWRVFTIDMIDLHGCRDKVYRFHAVTKSYNEDLDDRDDENCDKFEFYAFSAKTYLCIAEYYKDHPNEDGVRIFTTDDDCDSDEGGDQWEYVGKGKEGAKVAAAEAARAKAAADKEAAARRY
jgi:hypothetical protein